MDVPTNVADATWVRRVPAFIRRVLYNRTAAFVVGSLLYTLRSSVLAIILRGKWWSFLWSFLKKRESLKRWKASDFNDRVQAALYVPCPGGRIEKRTLFEDSLASVLYGNSAAASSMRRAAKRCSRQHPFLTEHIKLTHPLLNAVLNKLSSLAAASHLAAESETGCDRRPLMPVWYVFAIIGYSPSEGFRDNDVETGGRSTGSRSNMSTAAASQPIDRRSSKLRVVCVREDRLRSLSNAESGNGVRAVGGGGGNLSSGSGGAASRDAQLSERHALRRDILRRMASLYKQQHAHSNDSMPARRHLLRVQLGYTSPTAAAAAAPRHMLTPGHVRDDASSKVPSPAMFTPRRP